MKDIKELLFDETLRICDNRKNNKQEITKWFTVNKIKITKNKSLKSTGSNHSQLEDLEESKHDNLDPNDWVQVDEEDLNDYSDFEDTLIEI